MKGRESDISKDRQITRERQVSRRAVKQRVRESRREIEEKER